MVEMKWKNPPSRSSRGTQYDEIIEELKKHPGRWALISEDWKTSGPPSRFKKAGCEATCRANKESKTWSLYARYAPKGHVASTAPGAGKAAVAKAVATGTALTPPPATPRTHLSPALDANEGAAVGGYLAARRARGIPAEGK